MLFSESLISLWNFLLCKPILHQSSHLFQCFPVFWSIRCRILEDIEINETIGTTELKTFYDFAWLNNFNIVNETWSSIPLTLIENIFEIECVVSESNS